MQGKQRFFLWLPVFAAVVSYAQVVTVSNSQTETISDNTCFTKTLSVADSLTIGVVRVDINITHTWRADLDITLTSPAGTAVDLTSDNGGSADNLYARFFDDAGTSIVGDTANHTQMVDRRPEGSLSDFSGENSQGSWSLQICDDAGGDTGTFYKAVLYLYDSFPLSQDIQVDFRMDECYWLGGANGVDDDVKDSSGNALDAQSRNRADNTNANYRICRGGDFINTYADQTKSDAVFYPNETADELNVGKNQPFSVSAWVYRHDGGDKWMAAVIKVSDDSWSDGWGLEHELNSGAKINFFVGDYQTYAQASVAVDTWTHIVGTYDGSTIRIYKNGSLADSQTQSGYTPGSHAISIGDDILGSSIDDRWQGNLDEVKIWARALSANEVQTIYNNENAGLNYDGAARSCDSCNGTSISAHSWELVGIPADGRASGGYTVSDVFADDMQGTFDTDWRVYKRTYSSTDNSSGYQQLGLNDMLEFGQGYWLGSKLDEEWYVNGLTAVDYNSTENGTSACVSATGKCVDIQLTPATKDFNVDPNDGSGNFRNNMLGFIGIQNPVNWADCRLIFDDNGTAYTPSDANASGLANKQIWMYDPASGDAAPSGYVTCADDSPGGCKLVPFKGFWIQLTGKTKGHTVKLVVPEE